MNGNISEKKKRLTCMNKNSLRADKHFIVDTQQDHMFAQNQCKKNKKHL